MSVRRQTDEPRFKPVLNLFDHTRVNVPICQKKRANEHSPFVRADEPMSVRRQTNEPRFKPVLNLFDHTRDCLLSLFLLLSVRDMEPFVTPAVSLLNSHMADFNTVEVSEHTRE